MLFYEINLYIIPPNKPSQLKDFGNFLFLEEEKYLNKIKDNIKEVIINKKRSALLISNLIAKGKEFYDILFNENIENVIQYFNEDDNSTIQNVLDI